MVYPSLIASSILIISVACIIMLNVPLFAGTFWVSYSTYPLVFCAKITLHLTEFIRVYLIEVRVCMSMSIFFGGSFFVS